MAIDNVYFLNNNCSNKYTFFLSNGKLITNLKINKLYCLNNTAQTGNCFKF